MFCAQCLDSGIKVDQHGLAHCDCAIGVKQRTEYEGTYNEAKPLCGCDGHPCGCGMCVDHCHCQWRECHECGELGNEGLCAECEQRFCVNADEYANAQ